MEEIKLGDTVQLKSGGPLMTVILEKENNIVSCRWFDNKGLIHTEDFSKATLYLDKGLEPFSI